MLAGTLTDGEQQISFQELDFDEGLGFTSFYFEKILNLPKSNLIMPCFASCSVCCRCLASSPPVSSLRFFFHHFFYVRVLFNWESANLSYLICISVISVWI